MNNYIELLVTLGFLGGLLWAMLKFMLRDIHTDLNELKKNVAEIKEENRFAHQRIDNLFQTTNDLYKTLIELVRKKD